MSITIKNIKLESHPYGWKGKLPDSYPEFFGHTITLDIHTRVYPDMHKPVPPIDALHMQLAEDILGELGNLLPVLEKEYENYQKTMEHDEWREAIYNPEMYLTFEDLKDQQTKWAFVVERYDWEDFCTHLEFEGTRFMESWAAV